MSDRLQPAHESVSLGIEAAGVSDVADNPEGFEHAEIPPAERPSALLLTMAFARSPWAERVKEAATNGDQQAHHLLQLLAAIAEYTPEPAQEITRQALQTCVDANSPDALQEVLGIDDWDDAPAALAAIIDDIEGQVWQLAAHIPLVPSPDSSGHAQLNRALETWLAGILADRHFEPGAFLTNQIVERQLNQQEQQVLHILTGAHFSAQPDAPAVYVEASRLQDFLEHLVEKYQPTDDTLANQLVKNVLGLNGEPQTYRQALRQILREQPELDPVEARLRFEAELSGEPMQEAATVESQGEIEAEDEGEDEAVEDQDKWKRDEASYRHTTAEQAFSRRVRQVPLLDVEQEVELAKKIEAGQEAATALEGDLPPDADRLQLKRLKAEGERAKQQFIEANLRLVFKRAEAFRRRLTSLHIFNANIITMDDIRQQATFGLIRAVEKFDYRKGYKFSTYASYWIRQSIELYLDEESLAIRLPGYVAQGVARARRVMRYIHSEFGREPTQQEVRTALEGDYTPAAAGYIMDALSLSFQSGDQAISDDENSATLFDILPDSVDKPQVHVGLVREEAAKTYAAIQKILTPRQWIVLVELFGIYDHTPKNLQVVADDLGIHRSTAAYMLRDAFSEIKKHPELLHALQERLRDLDEEAQL